MRPGRAARSSAARRSRRDGRSVMEAWASHYATFLEFSGIDVLVLAAAVWSLVSVRRSLRRDRERDGS
ncbi:hypothetical protein Apmu_0010_03 [Acidiphilium multivorum AIU301]|nr:hypothetical protein Apmu_0010_03 [Acidiphilium multivorum AIU301]